MKCPHCSVILRDEYTHITCPACGNTITPIEGQGNTNQAKTPPDTTSDTDTDGLSNFDRYANMSYRERQKELKSLNLNASGKSDELLQRLLNQ